MDTKGNIVPLEEDIGDEETRRLIDQLRQLEAEEKLTRQLEDKRDELLDAIAGRTDLEPIPSAEVAKVTLMPRGQRLDWRKAAKKRRAKRKAQRLARRRNRRG